MHIHEYQAKSLFRQFNIQTPEAVLIDSVSQASDACTSLGGELWVVKAQVHAGGRGKGGGVMELDMQYLYNDGSEWNFMDPDTFEQYLINDDAMDDVRGYLVEQDMCVVTLWNDNPISVTPPNHVMLEVVDTDPGLKGDTAGTGGKPATMNTGVVVQVPLFISIGEKVKVDTRTNEYAGRS